MFESLKDLKIFNLKMRLFTMWWSRIWWRRGIEIQLELTPFDNYRHRFSLLYTGGNYSIADTVLVLPILNF